MFLLDLERIGTEEPLLPAAWIAASLLVVANGHYVLALGLSFVFFLTGLRLIHNAFHSALGLSRRTTDVVLWIMSLLMLGSMHAVQYNHLRHHKLTLGEGDVEGRHADMPAWRALLLGPIFPILLHVTALRRLPAIPARYGRFRTSSTRSWSARGSALRVYPPGEAIGHASAAGVVVPPATVRTTLRGQCATRSERSPSTCFTHRAPSLPRVPTCHLKLSRRIDGVAPGEKQDRV